MSGTYQSTKLPFHLGFILTPSLPGRTPYGVLVWFCIALEPRGLITRGFQSCIKSPTKCWLFWDWTRMRKRKRRKRTWWNHKRPHFVRGLITPMFYLILRLIDVDDLAQNVLLLYVFAFFFGGGGGQWLTSHTEGFIPNTSLRPIDVPLKVRSNLNCTRNYSLLYFIVFTHNYKKVMDIW